jgi:hypothetical protein
MEDQTKYCKFCDRTLPLSEYNKMGPRLQSRCRKCQSDYHKTYVRKVDKLKRAEANRKWRLQKEFGISLEEYDVLLEKQNGVCAICGLTEKMFHHNSKRPWPLCVDHDHQTGKVRGLLCNKCNTGLGKFNDDADLMGRAWRYLTDNLD